MKILETQNYSEFNVISGNRVINKKKVERLIDDIKNGLNLLPYCPIIVYKENGLFQIVDGQHRFETSKTLDLPVYYVMCDKLDLRQIARLNSRSDKWSNKDFLQCYIKLGVEDYKVLSAFIDKYNIVYSAAIELLMYNKVQTVNGSMDRFRDGEFRVKHLESAERLVQITQQIFGRYKFSNDRYLIGAMQKLLKIGKCDIEVLKQKIASAPMQMNPQTSIKEYIYNIERVYNYNNSKRTTIF